MEKKGRACEEKGRACEENRRDETMGYGWASLFAIFVILIFHYCYVEKKKKKRSIFSNPTSASPTSRVRHPSDLVSDADLKFLIQKLDDVNEMEKWERVVDKSNHRLSYTASCFKPKDAPLKYLSVTVFENCSPELLRDFYMDNEYRLQWDKTLLLHHQLHVDFTSATEVGRTVKKFPLLTPREYVLAWRLWKGNIPHNFYCFIKECEHPSAPRHKKYVRVGFLRSGWRIRKVPGRNACEIKMYHQEDAGLNVEMAKLVFARGIWSYVCKMDNALRKYIERTRPQIGPTVTAVSLMQKVPLGLEMNIVVDTPASPTVASTGALVTDATKEKKFGRRPSRKVLANGLLLIGGVICLSRGHSSLGAKVAMAYILTKLRKRDGSPRQSRES